MRDGCHYNVSAQETLLAGQLDVILFAGQDVRRGIVTTDVLDLPPYVLAPEGHEITSSKQTTLSAAARYQIILLDKLTARPRFNALFGSEGITPNIVAYADSTEMVRGLVGAGVGIAVLSMRPLIDRSNGDDSLCAVPPSCELPQINLVLARAEGRPRRLVTEFIDRLNGWAQRDETRQLIAPP